MPAQRDEPSALRGGPSQKKIKKVKIVLDISEKSAIIIDAPQGAHESVGVDWLEGPPVPIPNTEVKLKFVDDTRRVTARENR